MHWKGKYQISSRKRNYWLLTSHGEFLKDRSWAMTPSLYTSENGHQLLSIKTWKDNACERQLVKSNFGRGTDEVNRPQTSSGWESGTFSPSELCGSRIAASRQKNQLTALHIVALRRRELCRRVNYFFPDLCHCQPLQHVPQRCQLFFSPTGITDWPIAGWCSSSSPSALLCAPASRHGHWIHPLAPASCSTKASCCSL